VETAARIKDLERFKQALDQHAIVAVTNASGVILEVNDKFCEISGYRRDELVGATHRILKSGYHPPAFFAEMWRKIARGEIWRGEVCNRAKSGALYWVETTIVPFLGENGKPERYIAIRAEITQKKEADAAMARLRDRLGDAQRLEAVGRCASTIAHEFNNALAGIIGSAALLERQIADQPAALSFLRDIERSAKRAAAMAQEILSFGRPQRLERSPLKVSAVLDDAARLLRASAPAGIEIATDFPSDGAEPPVLLDATKIHQVAMNLGINAVQAIGAAPGRVEFSLARVEVDEAIGALHPDLDQGTYVRFAVRDTGCGMDSETVQKAFEPYFSTKREGAGSGIGLAVARSIILAHGGGITCYSEVGRGTTFGVYLPVDRAHPKEETAEPGVIPRGNGEAVLLLDDDVELAAIYSQLLDRFGFRPVAMSDPLDALSVFGERPDAVDAVVTDYSIPGMNGVAFLESVFAIRKIPAILTSGHGDLPENLPEGVIFLPKPLRADHLAAALNAALGQ
jgi:PAS domain S-box-containing protein